MSKFSAVSSRGRNKVIDLRKGKSGAGSGARTVKIFFPQERKSPVREHRRKMRAIGALIFIIVLAGTVEGISAISYLPQYSVNNISVLGTKIVSPKLVRAYTETLLHDGTTPVISRGNIFAYPRDSIEKGIAERFPRVLSAKVSRESFLAQAITVAISERQQFASWCADKSKCYAMDNGGFIFADAATSTTNAGPIFRGGITASTSPIRQIFLPGHFTEISDFFKVLRHAGFAPAEVEIIGNQDFTVLFSEGFFMKATLGSDANNRLRNLEIALTAEPIKGKVSKLEYIDLRFGNRVYYKFKEGMQEKINTRR